MKNRFKVSKILFIGLALIAAITIAFTACPTDDEDGGGGGGGGKIQVYAPSSNMISQVNITNSSGKNVKVDSVAITANKSRTYDGLAEGKYTVQATIKGVHNKRTNVKVEANKVTSVYF